MKYVEIEELIDLSLGATLLGSGGGGSPDYDILMAEKHTMEYGRACLVDVDELKKDDLIVPIAFAGAPLVATELLPSGRECEIILKSIQEVLGKKPTHLMPAEIGGANALCPFLFAARLNMPIVDADTIGRAFPELQMSSCNLFGVSPSPAFVVDALGNHIVIKANNAPTLEAIARQAIVAMGSSALVGIYLMDGELTKKSVVKGTVTQAILLGKSIRDAKTNGKNPLTILENEHGARLIGQGSICQINQSIDQGFLSGMVSLTTEQGQIDIAYQNEFLKIELAGVPIAMTPDIIVLLDSESYLPVTSEKLLYGTRVTILTLPAPSIWKSKKGLRLVGPDYFGYNVCKKNEVL
jgi:uncharacterized protein